MKRKHLIIGVLAMLCSFGGAYASSALVVVQWAKQGAICRQIIPVDCGLAGSITCSVIIGGVIYPAYPTNTCTVAATTRVNTPFPSDWVTF
jgi:hypothetical protein